MKAMLTLSLGGTYPTPPNTRRGMIEKPIAAAAVCARNLRRETGRSEKGRSKKPRGRSLFFTGPLNFSSHSANIYHSVALPGYCKRTWGRGVKINGGKGRRFAHR